MSTSASGGEIFAAPYVVEHTFRRSLGPVMSRFLTGLRDRRIEGSSGRGTSGGIIRRVSRIDS